MTTTTAHTRVTLLALLALFAPVAGFATDSPVDIIPVADFSRFDEFGEIKISPDGEHVAYTQLDRGREMLVVYNRKDKRVASGVHGPQTYRFVDYQWVSRSRLVFRGSERLNAMAYPTSTRQIYAVEADGTSSKRIYGYSDPLELPPHLYRFPRYASGRILSTLRHDDRHVLLTESPWRWYPAGQKENLDSRPNVVLVDTYTGVSRELDTAPLPRARMLVDNDDVVRFAVSTRDRSSQQVSWKPTADAAWTTFTLPGFREGSIQPQRFTADNEAVLFTGVRVGEKFAALHRLTLATQQVERVHAFADADVSEVVTDFADRNVIGVAAYTDRARYHWLDADSPVVAVYAGLHQAFRDMSVRVTSATDDGRLAVVFVSSDVNPGEYYLFDTQTKHADFLRAARRWIDAARMRPKRTFELVARDGTKLHGYVTTPAGEGPYPLVVLPHGGPEAQRDYWEFDPQVQLLASRGYAVLQLNYRGSSGYGMDFEAAGWRQSGRAVQDDLTDATRWAIEQKIAAADRICIFGTTFGGYAALMGAVREPKLYRCAIGYGGFYDLERMFSAGRLATYKGGRALLTELVGDDAADLRARSPVHHADRIEVPVLLIHGTNDWYSNYEQATGMRNALRRYHKTVEWMPLLAEGPTAFNEDTRREVYERILAFLDENLRQ